jgi:VNT family MFS transporter (synaptic vesicle glycoprotein 2)
MDSETLPLKLYGPDSQEKGVSHSRHHEPASGSSPATVDAIIESEYNHDLNSNSANLVIHSGGAPAGLGIGRFHYIASLICGLGNASDAVELLCVSFILPSIDETITNQEKGALSAAVFVGMLVGGLLAGAASDLFGRKPVLACSLGINALFGLLSTLSPTWQWLAASRVIAGVGVGGSIGVFGLFIEYLPTHRRGFFISLIACWWMIGQIFTAAVAWIIIGLLGGKWQVFAAVCAVPAALASALTMLVLPESPRYHFTKGNVAACIKSLEYMARISGRRAWVDDGEQQAWLADCSSMVPPSTGLHRSYTCSSVAGAKQVMIEALGKFKDFWHPSLRKTSSLLLVIWFALSFGWYGLVLWIPSLFQQVDLDLDPYQDSFMVAAANVPGNIFAAVFMDRIGRKWMMVGSLIGACGSALLFAFAKSKALVIIAACLLNAISVGSWNSLDCLSTESFPTSIRSSAMGYLAASGRVGSIVGQFVFGAMINVSVSALLSTAAAVLAIGGIASWMLPSETANKQLEDLVIPSVPPPRTDTSLITITQPTTTV